MDIAFEQSALEFQQLVSPVFSDRKIKLSVARLDKLHPEVSGNKLFKLQYFLQEAMSTSEKRIITFGGAYSNHLVATAYACSSLGIKCIGIVRGEERHSDSHTLQSCRDLGMELRFVSRSDYKKIATPDFIEELKITYGMSTIIPEGGYHSLGAKGASLIMQKLIGQDATHVCVPVGTATTLAGLLSGANCEQVIGVPVLKNMNDLTARIRELTGIDNPQRLEIFDEYHFGGYARVSPALIDFMNVFFAAYKIPLDFVYTAKMMFGIIDKVSDGYFAEGSHIICLHTGGLQGNKSLSPYNLTF